MAIIHIDPNDFRYKKKTPSMDDKERHDLVLAALFALAENNAVGQLNLIRNSKNQLDKLYRYEVITELSSLAKQSNGSFIVDDSNYGKEIVPLNEREDTISPIFTGKAKGSEPIYRPAPLPENTPIALTLRRGFDNWRYSYLHKKTIQLADLSPANFQKVLSVVSVIDEKFQLNSSPDVEMEWNPLGDYDNHDARQDALNFLSNKGVIKQFDFFYSSMGDGSHIEVILNVREFQAFKEEVYKFGHKQPVSQPPPPKSETTDTAKQPFKSRKWEEISIQFLDGNNAKITAKNMVVKAHYKEMGFEDARSRKPDQQWELLRLLAEHAGELDWQNSDAKDNFKKKKQLLSKSLQDYFGIEGDPFYPYKEQNSYRLKITLTPESGQQ